MIAMFLMESIMMNTQELQSTARPAGDAEKTLASGQVLTLGTGGGEVKILSGRVWLTSPGDLDDHVLAAGESFRVAGSGPTLVEAWDPQASATIAWRPRPALQRLRDALVASCSDCWELMNPAGRVGIGTAAALAAVIAAALLFGPLSEAKVRALAKPPTVDVLLHNAGGVAVGATEPQGHLADGSDTRDRSSRPAQEAGRRAPGAA
jgi:hypothetical protein